MTGEGKERGVVLIAVLLVLLLIATIAASITALSLNHRFLARSQETRTELVWAADGAIHRAMAEIVTAHEASGAVTLPMTKAYEVGRFDVRVGITSETGRVDLSLASEEHLAFYLTGQGVAPQDASTLAARIADWRDADDLKRLNGAEAADYRLNWPQAALPANRPFLSIDELAQIPGFEGLLLDRMLAAFTIYDGKRQLVLGAEPEDVLTLPLHRGGFIRIRAVCCDGTTAPLARQAVVQFTGKLSDPFWTHDWRTVEAHKE